jgi:hypothetical protein
VVSSLPFVQWIPSIKRLPLEVVTYFHLGAKAKNVGGVHPLLVCLHGVMLN